MKSFLKKIFFIALFAVVLAACAKIDSGIKGTTYVADCTGQQVATDCTPIQPYPATLQVFDQNVKLIKTIFTKKDGTFSVALKPGTYYIHPLAKGTYPVAPDFRVQVKPGAINDLTIYYDNGIR